MSVFSLHDNPKLVKIDNIEVGESKNLRKNHT